MQNNTQYTQEDEIDLRELFSVLKKRKKLIWGVTALFTLLALIYVLTATPWWEANVTMEIGKYMDSTKGTEVYLENGEAVAERLQIECIDINKNIKDRDSEIKSVGASKKNPQFISIVALAKENKLAVSEIQKVLDGLEEKHQKVIDEIIAQKQSVLDKIDRSIFQINHNEITKVSKNIEYIEKVELPSIDKKIATIESNLKNSIAERDESIKNLTALSNQASLAALRLAQIQGLGYKISENEMQLIVLNTKKQKLLKTELPALARELERIKNIDLVGLQEKRKLAVLAMQAHNYHNTKIVGSIITQDHPIKPKKTLIVVVAFVTGLMLSIFLAFFLEFIKGSRKEEDSE